MFDTTLMASKHRRDAGRTLAVLPLALAAHALALGLVVVGQLWAVDPVHDVVLVPALVVHLPPPLGGGDGTPGRRSGQRAGQTRAPRQQIVQPVVVPVDVPRATNPEPPPESPRVPENEELGERRGTGPRIGDGLPRPVAEDDHRSGPPRRIGGDIKAPVAIAHSAPQYPESARRMRVEGVVVVEAVIDESGNVVRARVLNDIGMGCGDAAVGAIRTWKYKPATLNGRAVSVFLEVRVKFQLDGGE